MRPWLLIGLLSIPALVGMLVAMAFEAGLLPESSFVLRVRTSSGAFAVLLGVNVSVLALVVWQLTNRWKEALRRASIEGRRVQDEAHRRFIHRLNHELKNPLTAIRAGLVNLEDTGCQSVPMHASLDNVRQQVDRLDTLTNDLRKLADLKPGVIEQEPVDLLEVIEQAVGTVRSTAGRQERQVAISVQKLPWPLSPVKGDRDLLLLAIYNLLDNALKFSGPDAPVEIRAGEDGAQAMIEIIDTGRGIAPQDIPHITEELYRGQGARGIDGSGLGLSLVDRVAALHGGRLAIRSREGQGTVAALRLPLLPR